jgi:hypothetical protein
MNRSPVFAVVVLVFVACKKNETEAPPATTETPAAGSSAPAAAPTPSPAPPLPPPPTPVKLTAEELKPTCAKIITPELAAKTHGATEVKEEGNKGGGMTICQMFKGPELLGSATIACAPDLDPTAIERERGAMTKAKDLTPSIGRGGYRLSSNFTFIDDETPCRVVVNWMTMPADDVWPDALRAIVAAINPGTLK